MNGGIKNIKIKTMNDYIYEFEITLPDGELCYQVNNSPKLTEEFVDFLEYMQL